MIEVETAGLGRILVIDLETAPDPMAVRLLPLRERSKPVSAAAHRIMAASMLEAEESADGGWCVCRVRTFSIDDSTAEIDVIRAIDRALLLVANDGGLLVSFNGRRHDITMMRMRAAAHLAFGMAGIASLSHISHRDLMTDSIAGGGQWFKLRDVAAGLGIPVAHDVPSSGLPAASRAARKGEVDVAATFLVFLHDLAHRRSDVAPVLDGWRALGDYIRRAGPVGQHLAQFRRHLLGLGPDD